MSTPRDPLDEASPSGSAVPPHLDPRGARGAATRPAVPRVTRAHREPEADAKPAARTTLPRRTRRQRISRALSWLALSMAVVVLAVAAFGYWAFNHYDGQISRIDVFGKITGHVPPAAAPRNAQNFLLVGSDSREGANGEGTQGVGEDFVVGQRADTIILVHLYGKSDKVQLISFPRDTYVQIPAYTDPKTHVTRAAHMSKINSAFSQGGPPLLIATLEQLTDIRIDHFLQVDFTGFKDMVNKLGGVDVCLTKPAKDKWTGIDLPAGKQRISGDVALAFVRQRHGLPNQDIDRIARQQQFIGSLVDKVLSAKTLANPFKLNGFLDVATASLQVDKGLSAGALKDLALKMRNFSSGGVIFSTVPFSDINGRRNGASVVLLDEAKTTDMFDALRRDEAPGSPASPPTKPTATPALIVKPGNVRVSVFNGAGVAGLGRKAAGELTDVGFTVIGTPGNRGSGASQTTIYHGPDKADSARTLAAAIPGAVVEEDTSLGNTLELVVGSSYTGAKSVTVSGTPATQTPPKGPGTAAPPIKTAQDKTCTV